MEAASEARLALRPGTEQEIHAILSGSRQVWGTGISLEDYIQYHSLIRHHPWSQTHFQHLVLADDRGDLFSSCKVYYHEVRVEKETFKIASIGAVFTPASFRSKGYARQMLEHMLDQLRDSGYDLVMLFSDIGTEFYARLNFRVVRKYDPVYAFQPQKMEPAEVIIYEYLPADLLDWHLAYSNRQKFSLVRSKDYFQLLSDRIDWHKRYMGFREQRIIVSPKEQSYLWVDLSRWQLVVRDFATVSPDPGPALSRLLAALHAKYSFKELGGWLPKEFDSYYFLKLKEKHLRNKTILMITALNPKAESLFMLPDDEIHLWLADYF